MEVRTASIAVCALVLFGAGALVVYQFDASSLKNELRQQEAAILGIKASNEDMKAMITKNADAIAKMSQQVSDLGKEIDVIAAVENGIPAQEKGLEQAKEKWQQQFDSLQIAIRRGREAMTKQEFPELKVKGGNILTNCKLVLAKNGGVSWQHSSGIARLASSQLPAAVADQLRPDAPPSLSILPDPATVVAAAETPDAAAAAALAAMPEPATAVAQASSADKSKEAKLQEQLLVINQLKRRVSQLTSQMDGHMRTYYDHTQKANYARMMGRSSSQGALASKARDNASKVQAQIDAANFQLNQLQSEVAYSQ